MGRMQETEPAAADAESEPDAPIGQRFTVADGFRFGCGFSLALFGAVFILLMIVAIVFLLAMLVGLPVPAFFAR